MKTIILARFLNSVTSLYAKAKLSNFLALFLIIIVFLTIAKLKNNIFVENYDIKTYKTYFF